MLEGGEVVWSAGAATAVVVVSAAGARVVTGAIGACVVGEVTPGGNDEDVVVTAGFSVPGAGGSVFPQGILIGRVSRVLPGDASPERFVQIRPKVDFAALSVVLVVTATTAG